MLQTLVRWTIPLVALLLAGPLAGALTGSLRNAGGDEHASLFVCASPVAGVLAGLGAFGLAAAMGFAGTRWIGLRAGMFSAGLVLAWAAWGTGRIDRILNAAPATGTLYALGAEGLLVGVAALALAVAMVLIPTAHPGAAEGAAASAPIADEPRDLRESALGPAAMGVLPIALLAGGVAAWVIAQETLKGQTVAAAVFAGVLAGAAGRLSQHRVSAVVIVAAVGILAAVSPVLGAFLIGSGGPGAAADAGTLFNLARPLPLDWAAGAFLGVPLGLTWAGSMVEKHTATGQ